MMEEQGHRTARDKIVELERLAEKLAGLRAEGKTVVHCHGVFDVLHIGHIRHFEEAKQMGDVLVVTVTPDRYVNKGPHRPAFEERLRAESIAALDCVDHVAINGWPIAVEAIKRLSPNIYVKGSEYQIAEDDHSGGIVLEQEAVESIGGSLVFTNDITFSSSGLVNRHLPVFTKNVSDYLVNFSSRHQTADILGYFEGAMSLKTLVIGEAIVDEYQYCRVIGKSSKEPMLALNLQSIERFGGGIVAAANHVANFCNNVGMITFLGSENSTNKDFIMSSVDETVDSHFLHRKDAPTIVKRRFVEEYSLNKLIEVYEMNDAPLTPEDDDLLCQKLQQQIPNYDVVIVFDFGHGMLSKRAIDIICSESRFLAVNAQSNAGNLGFHTISRYQRADFACMAENEIRLEARDRQADLKDLAKKLSDSMSCHQVVVTRSKHGCLCYGKDDGFFEIPALAGQVVDRIGAGDAFLAVTALFVAQSAPTDMIGFVGNAVGAEAVATVGHRSSIQRTSLLKHIESLMK